MNLNSISCSPKKITLQLMKFIPSNDAWYLKCLLTYTKKLHSITLCSICIEILISLWALMQAKSSMSYSCKTCDEKILNLNIFFACIKFRTSWILWMKISWKIFTVKPRHATTSKGIFHYVKSKILFVEILHYNGTRHKFLLSLIQLLC